MKLGGVFRQGELLDGVQSAEDACRKTGGGELGGPSGAIRVVVGALIQERGGFGGKRVSEAFEQGGEEHPVNVMERNGVGEGSESEGFGHRNDLGNGLTSSCTRCGGDQPWRPVTPAGAGAPDELKSQY